jgi:signal transduction histidine kinase/ActR/RegA family two-component response regulator
MENTGMLEGEYQDYGANADALLTKLHKRVMAGNKHQEALTLTDCASLNKAFAQGNTHFEMELLYAFKLNKPTWVNGILDILENPLTGKLEAFFFLVDIQQQKMKELQYKTHLEEALAAAEKANVAKSEFLSTMSHEIRTPMNVIAGFTGIALAECQDPAIASYLRKITFSNTLLLGIINDVLDMNKLESNKVALQLETVAPREFLSAMQELVEPQMREKHIDFVVEYVDELPAAVKLDKLRCQQIFMNIFSNAAKFTNEYGKVELIVKCLKTDDGKCLITTIAKDNGIGMSPEFQKKLFLPFEQENDVRVSKYTGTGIGMAIVKNLIAIMGGSISVRSTKNVGTEYTIELPLELGNPVDIKEAGAHIGTFETPQFTGKRILLAEDQPLNVEIATRLLRKQGFSVDTVVNGQECLERFEAAAQGYYAAILMDIRMPIMTGLEAAQAIRRLERNDAKAIPIIAMTANAFVTDRDEALAAGMNDHVAKPVEPQVLYNTLAKYIL